MTVAAQPKPQITPRMAWKMAVRLPTLTAAVAPVFVGSGVALKEDQFALLPALVAMLGAILLQIGANFANDVYDFKRGADTADRLGPPRASQMGLLTPKQMYTGMITVFAMAMLSGIYLVYVGGWPIVAVGIGSIIGAIIYTGGPWPIGYHALGDVFTFVFFGLVAVVGTYYVQADSTSALAWTAAVPIGCTVTMILIVNNLRDIETDRRSGKTTLGVIMGDSGTRLWYYLHLSIALLVPLFIAVAMDAPGAALAVLSIPWAWPLLKAIRGGTTGRALNPILQGTARFNLVLAVLFAVGLAVS